eukprot:scaffold52910_cov55-Phaeocystis_antarctica.AAC.3
MGTLSSSGLSSDSTTVGDSGPSDHGRTEVSAGSGTKPPASSAEYTVVVSCQESAPGGSLSRSAASNVVLTSWTHRLRTTNDTPAAVGAPVSCGTPRLGARPRRRVQRSAPPLRLSRHASRGNRAEEA